MRHEFNGIFNGMTVMVTGHTGFKGSWLAIWLRELGAHVVGYSLDPPTRPSNFEVTGMASKMTHVTGDIRDYNHFKQTLETHRPQVVFHLAAQAIVLHSYTDPKETFEANAIGTVNVLEAARGCPFVRAMVMVTTDKCYENKEWIWGYRENDPLGGNDPYSASKAMAELAINSYRASFFSKKGPALASARAGNVIGGGDFSEYRIVPDTMKSLLEGKPVLVRNPHSVRPWLHVLDPLRGYLSLAAALLEHGREYAQAWNFGPLENQGVNVKVLVEKAIELWGEGTWTKFCEEAPRPEMNMLRLNWDRAANFLQWQPAYHWEEAIAEAVDWFKAYRRKKDMYAVCAGHIDEYVDIWKTEEGSQKTEVGRLKKEDRSQMTEEITEKSELNA